MGKQRIILAGMMAMLCLAGCGRGQEVSRQAQESTQILESDQVQESNQTQESEQTLTETQKSDLALIHAYEKAVNEENVKEYISLFCSEIREEMNAHVERAGEENFFGGMVEILSVAQVKDSYVSERAASFGDAMGYEDYAVYYVTQKAYFGENADDGVKQNGVKTDFVLIVVENGERYLYRISQTPELEADDLMELE